MWLDYILNRATMVELWDPRVVAEVVPL